MSATEGVALQVVVNCRFLTQPVTGVQRFAQEITTALLRQRDDVVLVAPRRGDLRRTELLGHSVERIGRARGHAWEQLDLPRDLRRRGPALLVNLANTGPLNWRPQIATIHDLTYLRHPEAYSWRFRLWYRFLTPRLARTASALVTVSDFSRQELYDRIGDLTTVKVIPNAVASWLSRAHSAPRSAASDSGYYLLVGSISAHKNQKAALAGFREYRSRGGQAELLIVGTESRSFAAQNIDLPPRSRALGRVSDAELMSLYFNSRAFVFPSLYEGFGIPPLEAQATGTPVLASNIPALRETLAPASAMWWDPHDPSALASAMLELEGDPARRAGLIDAGMQNVARYSWESSARLLSHLIDEVLARQE